MLDFLSALWEMSLTGAYAAAILIVLRLILKRRAPRQVLCLLWLVVFARLLIPVSLESPLSIVPEARPVQEQLHLPQQEAGGQTPGSPITPTAPVQNPAQGQAGTAAGPVTGNPEPSQPTLTPPQGVHPAVPRPEAPAPFPWQTVLAGVWLAGGLAMAGYGLISYLGLRRRLFDAIRAQDGAWEHPAVDSPFILGMLRPRIYLPAGLTGRPRQFILCHERAHLRRLDHIVKPVCWAALALHWFNPLVWAAYLLMSRDIEAACDESVIRRLGSEVKADYSTTLLALATGRRLPAPSPLAFNEGDAKGRIKNVLGYRRPALWVIVVSVIAAVMAAVCLLTDPVAAEKPGDTPDPSPTVSASQPPEASLADALLDPWMKEVLDGERLFARGSDMETEQFSINQLRDMVYRDEHPDLILEVGKLAVMDLDRDGINEMVVWPVGGEPDDTTEIGYTVGYFIFRRQGDEVTVHYIGWRPMQNLKADGTFEWSSSAWNWGISRLIDIDTFETEDITWRDTPGVDDDNYFVDGLKATREEFNAAVDAQEAKPNVAWYTYEDGQLKPWLPDDLELAGQSDSTSETGEAKLWLEGGEIPWLEWNGSTTRLNGLITPAQFLYIVCRDYDGDGQNEVVIGWQINGFAQLDLYEWDNGQPVLADTYDTQQLLLRFNQNNVAGYNKDTRGLTVTYSHAEGDPDSQDYYRHYVTGSATLPEGFFDGGYEQLRDGYLHAYANQFQPPYLNDANQYNFNFEFYLADETMQELNYVDTPPYTDYANHYMVGKPVGQTGFNLSYDGAKWNVSEAPDLAMDYQDEMGQITDITSAAPLSAPVTDLVDGIPDDLNEWYKVAELPDDMIWVYARNYGQETLIRWDGNFYKVFDHVAHTGRAIPPELKKLGGNPDGYGPLAVISNVGSGTGTSLSELVVYDLDASSSTMDHVHDWKPLVDEFNGGRAFRYDGNTHSVICAYEGQTAELIIDGGDNEELYRRIDEEGIRLAVTGEIVSYRFNEDGAMEVEFPLQVFIGDDVVGYPLLWPWFLRWTIRYDSERAEFETVPGSCGLFTYAGQ